MLESIKKMFGIGPKADYKQLLVDGAQLIDVRSKAEFDGGSIKGAVNIPLQVLPNSFSKIKKDKPVIVFCASGMRSSSAKSILSANGFVEVHNGGGWMSLNQKLK